MKALWVQVTEQRPISLVRWRPCGYNLQCMLMKMTMQVHWPALADWIAMMLGLLRAKFNLANTALSFVLLLINAILCLIGHPMQAVIPTTMYQLNQRVMPTAKVDTFL